MKPKSHTLFHFTESIEVLKLIMTGGFWPRYCLEDIRWVGQKDFQFVAYPLVCFCDIPLARIDEHVQFYGSFGIGLTKEWARKNGLNPILYLQNDNALLKHLRELNTHANSLVGDEKASAKETMRYIFAYTKPSEGTMILHGKPVEKEFYQESEWRYVPESEDIESYLAQSAFEDIDVIDTYNESTKRHCVLEFTPSDVKYVFVKTDSDIPEIVNFIQTELDNYPAADLKILISRVISIESISCDL